MLRKRGWIIGVSLIVVLLLCAIYLFYFNSPKNDGFTKTSLIRMNLPLGGALNTSIKVTNYEKGIQTVAFSFNDFHNLAVLADSSFVLQPGESRDLLISFIDKGNSPGVYVGKLILESSSLKEEIPIIIGVEDPNHAFAIIQSVVPKYDMVYPGEKFGIDIKVFDLINSNVQSVKSNYVIKNLDNEIMINGNTDLVVEAGSKTEIINIPKEWDVGEYVFISTIDYKNTTSFSSYLFYVSSPSKGGFISNNTEAFLIIIILFVVIVLGLIIYFVTTRDSLLVQLKKQQAQELERNVKCLDYSRKSIEKSEVKPQRRKEKLRKLREVEKRIIKKIKEKQIKQKEEISHLKKKKTKKDVLKKKVDNWKKEGYKMYDVNNEVKKITRKGISAHIKEWNKQGYDTSFLNK